MKQNSFKRWLVDLEWSIIILLLVVASLRLAAPHVGKYYINSILADKLDTYTGSIDDLSLRVVTGSYFIDGLKIYKVRNPDLPFLNLSHLEIHLDWGMLIKGKALLKLKIENAQVNFVDSKDPSRRQLKVTKEEQQHWSDALDAIIPLSIEEIELKNLVAHFENKALKGAEENKLTIQSASILNLVDPEVRDSNLSPLAVTGVVNGHAKLKLEGGVNMTVPQPTVDLKAELKNFDLTSTNKLLKHYVPVDLTSGTLSLLAEAQGSVENLDGYARVYLAQLDILEMDQDYKSGPHFLIEWIGGFANWILDALSEGRITTDVPFKIESSNFKLDSSEAFFNTLENLGDGLPYRYKNEK